MLQACLNGSRSKNDSAGVPVTPGELAADAVAVQTAGAGALHIHPRNDSGTESLAPDDVAKALLAVRSAAPGMPVGVGTGAWIEPKFSARLELIRDWDVNPDYASVNFVEDDAPENAELLLSKGIGIEAGLWSAADARRFVRMPFARKCLRVLIEMLVDDPVLAKNEYHAVMRELNEAKIELPILLHGEGESVWPMIRLAGLRGHDTRAGFEDTLNLPDGSLAKNNGEIVNATARELSLRSSSL